MSGSPNFSTEGLDNTSTGTETGEGLLKNIEADTIKKVLEETRWNKTLAAEKLGISVTTLWRRLKSLEKEFNN